MYRAIYGYCGLKFAFFFTMSDNLACGHCFKIQKQYIRVNCREFSFANRCIDTLNSLDNDVLCASSVQAFKRRLSLHNYTKFLCVFYRLRLGMALVSACLTIHSFSSGMSCF